MGRSSLSLGILIWRGRSRVWQRVFVPSYSMFPNGFSTSCPFDISVFPYIRLHPYCASWMVVVSRILFFSFLMILLLQYFL